MPCLALVAWRTVLPTIAMPGSLSYQPHSLKVTCTSLASSKRQTRTQHMQLQLSQEKIRTLLSKARAPRSYFTLEAKRVGVER